MSSEEMEQDAEMLLQESKLEEIIRAFSIEPILGVGECSFDAFHAYFKALPPEDQRLDVDSMLCEFNRDLLVYAKRHPDSI